MSTTDLKAKTKQFIEKVFSDPTNAITEMTAPDIVVSVSQPNNIPLSNSYEGHDGLSQYLTDLNQHIDMGPIEYSDIYCDGNTVIGLGVEKSVARATGKSFEMPFVHVFRYNDAGKIVELRKFNNTQRLAVAFE